MVSLVRYPLPRATPQQPSRSRIVTPPVAAGGGGITPPTLAFSDAKYSTANGTLTSASFTPQTGDIIVVKGVTEDSALATLGTPSGGGWTYTSRVSDLTASHCGARLWTAPVTLGGTPQTVAVVVGGTGAGHAGVIVELWRNAQLAGTPATCDTRGSGAPSTTLTTTQDNSVVSWCSGDWAAVSGSSRTYNTTSATPTEDGYTTVATFYTGYWAYQSAATHGSQTLGLTAPTGQTWTLIGIEIQGTSAGGGGTPIALTDSGTSAETLAVTSGAALAEAGASAEALAVAANVPLTGAGAGTDALAITMPVALADAGAGTDALSVVIATAVALTGAGAGTDALAVTAATAISLTDAGTGSDTLAVTAGVSLTDAGTGADALTVTATVPLAEMGTSAQALAVTAAVALTDAGSGADGLTAGIATPVTDTGSGTDALSVVVATAISLTDSGAGSTGLGTVLAAVSLADLAAASETLAAAVVTAPFSIGVLTAADAPAAVLTAAAATATLTASDSGFAGGYPVTYTLVYPAAASGTLTASDQKAGGPG